MEIIKSQLFLLLSLSLCSWAATCAQALLWSQRRVNAACFGLSQSLGKGVRPNFLGQGLEKLWSSSDGFEGAGSPGPSPYLQKREWQHGRTCFWGTFTLQDFMPQIRSSFSQALQERRHLWDSLPGAVAVSPFFRHQPLYLVSHPH